MPNYRMGEGLKYRLTFVGDTGKEMIVTVQDLQTMKDLKVGERVLVTRFVNSAKETKKGE
jgi:hypothetical protein